MKKKTRVLNALLRKKVDKFPIFTSMTPQFLAKCIPQKKIQPRDVWKYLNDLNLDIIQVGHPSFYPVRVMDLNQGDQYTDEFHRTHVIRGFYDNFCAPFPLQSTSKIDLPSIRKNWANYNFPDPSEEKWFTSINEIAIENDSINDPLSIWGVINGPFEPTWQLLSDGWPAFFILARRDFDLALEIINQVTEYSIQAGQELIKRGANAIRIGDDYALNEGLMCAPNLWHQLIYPAHKKLVKGLKDVGGENFPVILHSDGNISSILTWLGEGGLDALNPIQPDALDFKTVVDTIGHKLSITGAFDLRYFVNPLNEILIKKLNGEVERLFGIIKEFNLNDTRTGFCIGPTHQIQPTSYLETFEKWVKIVHESNIKYFS